MQDMRALVVDDSKVGRLTMMKKLETMGLKVELAESGQQALDYLARHRPDMIFMDHMMPEMDGFEATRRIKALPAAHDIPVIIISGNEEATFIEEARAAGAIDAISKPPATGVLEKLLASLPKLSAQAPAPAPVAAKPAPAPSIDMTEVKALVERLIGAAVTPLHDDFMAEIGQRLETESGSQRKTLADWEARVEQQATLIAELRRDATEAETLGNRLQALEQRLLPLEAEAARPQPNFEALQADIAQRFAARLAESDARTEGLAPELESLRRDLHDMQARLDQHAAQAEQKASEWNSQWSSEWSSEWVSRLDTLAADQARVSQDVQSIRSTQAEYEQRIDQSIAQVRETLSAAEQAAAAVPEVAGEAVASEASADIQAMQAELDELRDRLSESRLQQLVAETIGNLQLAAESQHAGVEPAGSENLQAELDELRERLSKSRLQQLVTETVSNLLPAADTQRVVAESAAPPVASDNLQAELVQLRNKVKTLTVATAVGGALLMVAIGIAVFGG